MATINQIQDDIIEEFGIFDQWMDKYEYIIDLGKKLPLIEEQYRHEGNNCAIDSRSVQPAGQASKRRGTLFH